MTNSFKNQRLAYSVEEVAEMLGCSKRHIGNMIRRNELASVKLGARRVIPASVLHSILGQNASPTSLKKVS